MHSTGFVQKVENIRGSAAFLAVSLRLTGKGFFPRGYASALVSTCNSQGVEAQPQTHTTVFGKPEAYRKESGEAAGRLMKHHCKTFCAKAE